MQDLARGSAYCALGFQNIGTIYKFSETYERQPLFELCLRPVRQVVQLGFTGVN